METLEQRRLLASDLLSSQFFSGSLTPSVPLVEFTVDLQAGDRVAITSDSPGDIAPNIWLRDSAGNLRASDQGGLRNSNEESLISNHAVASDGQFTIQVFPFFSNYGDFELRVDVAQGAELEGDNRGRNDYTNGPDRLPLTRSGDELEVSIAGSLDKGDQDYFQLGYLAAGSQLSVDASDLPNGSTLRPLVSVFNVYTPVEDTNADPSIFQATIAEDGWYQMRISHAQVVQDGTAYQLNPIEQTWGQARQHAADFGGDLVSIETSRLNRFLAQEFRGETLWIGLNDEDSDGDYQWSDGNGVTFTNWLPGQPSGRPHAAMQTRIVCSCYDVRAWTTPEVDSHLGSIVELGPSADLSLTGRGFRATYVADITITDVLPSITSVQPELDTGASLEEVTEAIRLKFNQELDTSTIEPDDFALWRDGGDGTLGNSDDVPVSISHSYLGFTRDAPQITLTMEDGPLTEGAYRLVVYGSIEDLAGRLLDGNKDGDQGGDHVFDFDIAALSDREVLEPSSNEDATDAQELTFAEDPFGTGWFRS